MKKWSIEDSAELYNIEGWGIGYFSINKSGNVSILPKKKGTEIDLKELIEELQSRDISTPVLLRFPDILNDRIKTFNRCFHKAAEEYKYNGKYFNVYPIKVNQVKDVVEQIVKFGKKYNVGLEAGSKPELHAVLSFTEHPDAIIVCNGYKDESYIELALLAQKMGRQVFIVVEKLNELRLITRISKRLKVTPNIGLRIKLSSEGSGKWEDSGGDKSKFGLNASELLEAVAYAGKNNITDKIKLIHFHLGSQITNIRKIKLALREASQYYVQLVKSGCGIEYCDVGGGLGIDYDGTKTSSPSSVNYYIQEYFNDIVATFAEASDKNEIRHPNLITECGRSLTAHHSVLIFDVLESNSLPEWDPKTNINEDSHELIKELYGIYEDISSRQFYESWHDSLQIRGEALDLFSLGLLSLEERALIERLFWSVARKANIFSKNMKHPPEEFQMLPSMLADKFFCNFSTFQSLPDSWAIDQIFPIIPIQRLNEKPGKVAILQDITCDSDGKIGQYIGLRDNEKFMPVHRLKNNEQYFIGIFLVGAYQEILGDMHNLFGDTNVVHITATNNGYEIEDVADGEKVNEVLEYVLYNAKKLVRNIEIWVTKAVKEGRINSKEGKEFISNYKSGLYGYTYLE